MKAFVTGGGGFLGKAIVKQLLDRDDQVKSYSRSRYPDIEQMGGECVQGDLGDLSSMTRAMRGCDVVFHVAAKAGVWGPYQEFYNTNVTGSRNVLKACKASGVKKLVYTSSPSVIHAGGNVEGVDESAPYPDEFEAPYPETKAIAEKEILEANKGDFSTVALRPHLVWGPGDPNFTPRLVSRAKSGRLRLISGGPYLVDHVYIDNAAGAHLIASDKLAPDSPIAGKAYFITQGEPLEVKTLVNLIIGAAGVPPVEKTVPPWLAYAAGLFLESVYKAFSIKSEPPMTRFVARQLSTSHWFDANKSRNELGYIPEISTEEGVKRLRDYIQNNALNY